MDRQQAKALVERYNKGLATAEERALLENWYAKKSEELFLQDEEIDFAAIEAELRKRTFEYAGISEEAEPARSKTLWSRIAVAAAILLVAGAGVFFYTNTLRHSDAGQDLAIVNQNDIKPGSNGATLTLANGQKIVLSDAKNGELANEAGVTVTKTADGQVIYSVSSSGGIDGSPDHANSGDDDRRVMYNTLATSRGETFQVRLPDGTSAWLNAASTLKYPASFTKLRNRRVELSGEAYFEVAKDKAHPFIVQTDKQTVEVLGTHFNINAYKDEPGTKTTLLEGSISVIGNTNLNSIQDPAISGSLNTKYPASLSTILSPNQQATLTNGTGITVKKVDAQAAILWKNGKFSFNSEEMSSVMRKVARWYNVDVIFNSPVQSEKVSGSVSRFANMSTLLRKLEEAGGVHFKIEGRTIIVTN